MGSKTNIFLIGNDWATLGSTIRFQDELRIGLHRQFLIVGDHNQSDGFSWLSFSKSSITRLPVSSSRPCCHLPQSLGLFVKALALVTPVAHHRKVERVYDATDQKSHLIQQYWNVPWQLFELPRTSWDQDILQCMKSWRNDEIGRWIRLFYFGMQRILPFHLHQICVFKQICQSLLHHSPQNMEKSAFACSWGTHDGSTCPCFKFEFKPLRMWSWCPSPSRKLYGDPKSICMERTSGIRNPLVKDNRSAQDISEPGWPFVSKKAYRPHCEEET